MAIIKDPYWVEREDPSEPPTPSALYVDLDKPSKIPFGFGIHPEPPKKDEKKTKKKAQAKSKKAAR